MSTLAMCADSRCPHYEECYRAQAEPEPDQRFYELSPREGDKCHLYAPLRYTDGSSALKK